MALGKLGARGGFGHAGAVLGGATAPAGYQFVTATDVDGSVQQVTAVNTNAATENVWARAS